ncbi:MAG TPA: MFS transporter [Solirubrobacteraceae bacterium]|jgi:EmrB/QacA subfamily drug resistance transporter|nr:MFS transporter [Solirubrobacteraceae bacterium]
MPDTTSEHNRWLALYVLCTGVLMIVLDVTVVNVALPSIQTDLGFTQSGLAWVVNAYLIAFGGLLLLAGRVGDLIGHKRVFLIGLVIFTVASLVCGLADNQTLLVVARFVQGAGGAMTSAVVLGMIVTMFPEPGDQAKAIGVYGFVASAGGSVGLLAGGVLTQAIDWHWIFFINVPIGLVTGFAALRLLGESQMPSAAKGVDLPGAALIVASLMLGVYTIVSPAAEKGWGSGTTLGFAAGSLVLLALFIWREATAREPLMPLRVFRSRDTAGANAIQALVVAGMFGTFFLGSLYLQRVQHYDPLKIGLAFLPTTVVMGTLSLRYSERLIMRFGARNTLLPGMVLVAIGLLLFARVPVHGNYVTDVLPVMLLLGLGVGSSFPALMSLAMADVEPRDAGLASGLVNTSAQVGGALGLAVLATTSATHTNSLTKAGKPLADALTSGYHVAFVIAAGLLGLAILLSLGLRAPKRAIAGGGEGAVAEAAEFGEGIAPTPPQRGPEPGRSDAPAHGAGMSHNSQHTAGPPRESIEAG